MLIGVLIVLEVIHQWVDASVSGPVCVCGPVFAFRRCRQPISVLEIHYEKGVAIGTEVLHVKILYS